MAKDRELTLKLNLKPGDVRALKQTFKSISDEAAKIKVQARQRAAYENLKDKVLGRAPPEVLAAKGEKGAGGGPLGKASGLLKDMGLGGVGNALGSIAKMAGPAAAALGVYVGIFRTISSFVSKANPGAMQRMNMAWDDMIAVIGHALTPVIEIATKGFRLLGDFLKAVLPTSEDVRKAFKGLNDDLKDLRDALADLAPIIKELIKPTLALAELAVKLDPFFNMVRSWGNLKRQLGIESDKLPDSTGAAARPHTIQDPEAYAKSIYTAIASGQGKEPQKETAENTRNIFDILKGLPGMLEGLGATIGAKLFEGWQFIRDNWREILVGALTGGLGSIFGDLKGLDFSGLKDLPGQFAENLKSIPDAFSNAVNELPNALKNALTELPRLIAEAIRGVLPQLPGLPGLPGGGGGGGGGGGNILDAAEQARRRWLGF